ncbi:MAG: RNA-binding S4 domain-containing protein [Formosimonas sp.]
MTHNHPYSSAAAHQRKKSAVKPRVAQLSFEIEAGRDYMALCDLLRAVDLVGSGGAGKHMVATGEILVDGAVELRKTCKIRTGQVVTGPGFKITVTQAAE